MESTQRRFNIRLHRKERSKLVVNTPISLQEMRCCLGDQSISFTFFGWIGDSILVFGVWDFSLLYTIFPTVFHPRNEFIDFISLVYRGIHVDRVSRPNTFEISLTYWTLQEQCSLFLLSLFLLPLNDMFNHRYLALELLSQHLLFTFIIQINNFDWVWIERIWFIVLG